MDRFLLLVRYFHRKIMKQQDRSIFDISSSNWIAMMIRVQKRQDVSQLNYLKQFISYANILPNLSWQTSVCWGADVLLLLLPLCFHSIRFLASTTTAMQRLTDFLHQCHWRRTRIQYTTSVRRKELVWKLIMVSVRYRLVDFTFSLASAAGLLRSAD